MSGSVDVKVRELSKEEQQELERLKRTARMCKGVLCQMVRKLSGSGYIWASNRVDLDAKKLNSRFTELAGMDIKQYYHEYLKQKDLERY